ncbi:MAG TPA: ABC transporter [Pseudomonas sp.]|uniref:ABC1 kinase family protein n=1 Tax=Stutzerimonas xanthomarina TaxID=271420 RepID=UPI000E85E2CB|nr:AarF/ABC1/UbiB kinase family protein [Stutzerimonas xanthomarina]MBU0811689.1 AarF/ABC1/UbiB kinase family protein [Gammaproteobacteria bacterium]HAQ84917.1 ABC transporter [Pseudomonas sp.]MBK3848059.1 AarF/ABC1/UbiB kinase family protein [Stutzerimonas xanthomarina]MBU0852993.1 AarF/ABC1/UbiB kinase family protein [Gammaproteobacteria bacterium]MBU1301931.1 AarF/ABC1/UbiB kinase family protein [Gammaproteobacteria bacterium]|tara:strand:- start:213 stop:1520 length:1308 start_codon:yes stop_codon:yes gene_type:complete
MSRFSRPSTSALGRFLNLGGTGARIAGNLLVQRITPGKARIDWEPVGSSLGETLGQMKGPVLKLGQQASQWQDVLPQPISAALSRLQNQVPSLPFASLESYLQRLYDGQLYELFETIEPQPAAAASLGQVHRARDRQGRALIMKVQYPGIRGICDADLRQLRRLMPLGRLFGTPSARLESVYRELQRAIDQELDYEAERNNLERFRQHFSGWPGLRIPYAVPALCLPGVLVLEEVPGRSMNEVDQAALKIRQQLAEALCDWLAEQAFGLGLLHADPHPGNLAWTETGELVVYDFGSVVPLPERLLRAYVQIFDALRGPSSEALEAGFQALGGRQPGSAPPHSLYRRIHLLLHPLLQPGAEWDFRGASLHQQLVELSPLLMSALGSLQPASGTLLVNRTLEGHYWNLYRLGACLPVADLLAKHIEQWRTGLPDKPG